MNNSIKMRIGSSVIAILFGWGLLEVGLTVNLWAFAAGAIGYNVIAYFWVKRRALK